MKKITGITLATLGVLGAAGVVKWGINLDDVVENIYEDDLDKLTVKTFKRAKDKPLFEF